uniref:hypothetical protein n=1 Tax=Alistipes sp. TaxID=1872444 RepID=UPI004057089B
MQVIIVLSITLILSFFFGDDWEVISAIAPLAIAGIAAGVNALLQGIGGALGNRKKKKAYNEYLRSTNEANAEFNEALMSEIRSNYLDRADSQAAIRRIIDYNNEVSRRQQTNAIKGGASDEARVALAAQQSRALGDTIGQIAGQGAQYKAQLQNQLNQARHQQASDLARFRYGFAADTSFLDNMVNSIGQSANIIGMAAMMGDGAGNKWPTATTNIDDKSMN